MSVSDYEVVDKSVLDQLPRRFPRASSELAEIINKLSLGELLFFKGKEEGNKIAQKLYDHARRRGFKQSVRKYSKDDEIGYLIWWHKNDE